MCKDGWSLNSIRSKSYFGTIRVFTFVECRCQILLRLTRYSFFSNFKIIQIWNKQNAWRDSNPPCRRGRTRCAPLRLHYVIKFLGKTDTIWYVSWVIRFDMSQSFDRLLRKMGFKIQGQRHFGNHSIESLTMRYAGTPRSSLIIWHLTSITNSYYANVGKCNC